MPAGLYPNPLEHSPRPPNRNKGGLRLRGWEGMGGEGRGEGREGKEKEKGRVNLLQGVRGIDAPGFTCTPRRSIRNQNEPCTCLCLPGYGRYSFTDPEGWKAELACARARLLYEPYSRHKRQSAPFFSVLLLTSPLSSPSSADATNVNHADIWH